MNNENLRNLKDLTEEERRAIAVKGGKASVLARRERAKLKECFNIIANADLSQEEKQELKAVGIADEDLTNDMLIALRTIQRAKEGDSKALKLYLEMTDQDSELELKKQELQLKEYGLNINEYKASNELLASDFNEYLLNNIQNR